MSESLQTLDIPGLKRLWQNHLLQVVEKKQGGKNL